MKKIIYKIFRKQQPTVSENEITMPLPKAGMETLPAVTRKFYPTQIVVGTAQSVGMQRRHNEDALYAMNTVLVEGESAYTFGIFIIADGMGGHQSGELASGETVRVMADHLLVNLYMPLIENGGALKNIQVDQVMVEGVNEVQKVVSEKVPGGGTTLTAAVILGNQITFAHVGDSRAYFIKSDGTSEVITHDHSLVQRLQDLGQLTEEDALIHPQRNVLYRAIGQSEPFSPDITTCPIPQGGYLLMCSDGLWGVVPKQDVIQIVLSGTCPSEACDKLVKAANSRGGPDNISVILIQFL